MNLNDIKIHWEEVSEQFHDKGGISPTFRDPFLAELEKENRLNILATEKILDNGFYPYMSRIYHPLVVEPEVPKHDSPLNKIAAPLATQNNFTEIKKYSYNLLYILYKI